MTTLAQPASRSPRAPARAQERSASDDDPASRIAALFDAYCGFVCRVLRHHGVHEAALDDAVQDVFVTAYRRWSSFEGRSSARSWLYGIARRIAFRYRRSADARARRFVPSADVPVEGVDDPFARAQAAHSLAALLHELDADKRTVFVLTELEGMTAPEVAEALGIPLGTAYSRLRAAWQVLGRRAGREEQRLRRALPSLREPEPPPERRRQLWSLVVGGLPLPVEAGGAAAAAAATTGWLGQIKWLAVGTALGVGLLGARAAVVASSPRSVDGASGRSSAAEPANGSPRQAPAAVEIAIPPAPSRADAPGEPAMAPQPEASLDARTTAVDARPAPTEASRRASPSRAPIAPSDDGSLAAELALLRQAREALRDGRVDDALALLDRHAQQHPRGQLVDERRALEDELARAPTAP